MVTNILKNSIEALSDVDNKINEIKIEKSNNYKTIIFTVNREGIIPENYSKIFIPFLTTKKTGSGIGLSLSRQIMRLHAGELTFDSDPGVKKVFRLEFP